MTELEQLGERFTKTGHAISIEEQSTGKGVIDVLTATPSAGAATRSIAIEEDEAAEALASEVEHFRWLRGYDGIWSSSKGRVECFVDQAPFGVFTPQAFASMLKKWVRPEVIENGTHLGLSTPIEGVKVLMGPCTTELHLIAGHRADRRDPSLLVSGKTLGNEEEAKRTIERIADALLYRMDQVSGLNVQLRRERRYGTQGSTASINTSLLLGKDALSVQYDAEPMALYRYARNAIGMPLLQFLAYYQILEYYFGRFVDREARATLRRMMLDPKFDSSDDAALGKIVKAMRAQSTGRRGAPEQAQLIATVAGCVSDHELGEWFEAVDGREAYFRSKEAKMLHSYIINRSDTSSELRVQAARRIYGLRCRVVHATEGEAGDELLLPFSPEAHQLARDIELVSFVANKALLSTATKFLA